MSCILTAQRREWDVDATLFVVCRVVCRSYTHPSRTPSRSPARSYPEPQRSVSNPLDSGAAAALGAQSLPPPGAQAASSAHQFSAHASSHPHEPTISEEANSYVGRSVMQSQSSSSKHAGGGGVPPGATSPTAQNPLHASPRPAGSPRPPHGSPRHYPEQPMPSPRQGSTHSSAREPRDDHPRESSNHPRESSKPTPGALAPPTHGTPRSSTSTGTAPPAKRRQYRQVGDWVLQKTLGAGSMGKVKLGVNVHSQERCAVKIVPRHRDDPKAMDSSGRSKDESKEIRTVREASISLLLHHPYICGMRDFLVHQNHYYMVFEYIDGGQMLDYIIAHGRLRERAARKFARQIGSALDYCHHNNIVHRDLKIENILISNSGNIKIIDFGLSNLYSPQRHLSTFCGSLYFAAPELLNAKLYTGPEVDIWSFGIVLYVLVCGKVPFDDQSMPALHAKIKRGLAEYPAWLSSDCKSLLQRMLNTNPLERATLAEVLSHPWMTKGFDGRPDSHLIHREPLRADDIEMDVINRMQGFTFGTSEEIHDNLQRILNSEAYLRCVQNWEAKREARRVAGNALNGSPGLHPGDAESPKKKRFSGFDLKKKLFKEEKKAEEPAQQTKEPLEPSSGFDPLISIYFLAREKRERAKVYGEGHFASSRASLNGAMQPVGYSSNLPSLQPPPSAHGSGFEQGVPGSPRDPAGVPRKEDMLSATGVMQHPTADAARSDLADLPNAHRREAPQPAAPAAAAAAAAPVAAAGMAVASNAKPVSSQPVDVNGRPLSTENKHERRVSMGSTGQTSISGRTSQRTSNTPAPPVTPPDAAYAIPMGIVVDKSGGIRPAGAPELEEIEAADVANIDVKSVYLKGLFSVSTTSTKSARTLLRDISHVLDRIGIKYRPIRGGYECIHIPSIDLKSVVHGDEAMSSLHVPVGQMSIENSPSKNKLSLRNSNAAASTTTTTRGDSPSPALHDRGSSGTVGMLESASKPARLDLDDSDAWGAQFGANSTLCVRFEVFIVKVRVARGLANGRFHGSRCTASSSAALAATAGSTSS